MLLLTSIKNICINQKQIEKHITRQKSYIYIYRYISIYMQIQI